MRGIALSEGMFPRMETLHLSYNNIHSSHIVQLRYLKRLKVLDLASNDLLTLPEDLSFFSVLEDLNVSANLFSSNSTLVRPSVIFTALNSIPKLKKLNLSRNKLSTLHLEEVQGEHFPSLQDFDFSYNIVDRQEELFPTKQFKSLQMLNITGNPFATRSHDHYAELELVLQQALSAVVINSTGMTAVKKTKGGRGTGSEGGQRKLPYPKPVTLLSREA